MEIVQLSNNDTVYLDIAKQYCKFYIIYSSPEAASLYLQDICEKNGWETPPIRLMDLIIEEEKKYGFVRIK